MCRVWHVLRCSELRIWWFLMTDAEAVVTCSEFSDSSGGPTSCI